MFASMPRVVPTDIVRAIDRAFGWAKKDDWQSVPLNYSDAQTLAGIVNLLDEIPDTFLTLDGNKYADFVLSREALRHEVQVSSAGGKEPRHWPRPSDRNALCYVRHALSQCLDEAPIAGTSELTFIPHDNVRQNLRLDISSVETAIQNGEWKAATVLGGSVVEALLLWAVTQHDSEARKRALSRVSCNFARQPIPGDPESWDLIHYIEIARELNEISETTAAQARLAKDFRNLIHPGRESRSGIRCDRGTAYATAAAMHLAVVDLTERHRQ